jgi:hypothetical protein
MRFVHAASLALPLVFGCAGKDISDQVGHGPIAEGIAAAQGMPIASMASAKVYAPDR